MNKLFISLFVLVSCANPEPKNQASLHKEDNFDRAAHLAASGSRYVWNEAAQAWTVITAPDMMDLYAKKWKESKEAAQKFYQDHK